MKAVESWELLVLPFALAGAFISSLIVEFNILDSMFMRVVKNAGLLVSGYCIVRTLWVNKPFIFPVRTKTWSENPQINTHRDVFVRVPAKVHKKGKAPKVEIVKDRFAVAFGDIDYEIEENGDIMIYHPSNNFLRPWKEFDVRIEA